MEMLQKIRSVIVEDESAAREALKNYLAKYCPVIEVVGEAHDCKSAVPLLHELEPQLVFLDVEMPQMSGVECARIIQDMDPSIVIIFATAHDTYMGDAFEVYAFDYLVKPFKVDRVIQTLERARDRLLRRDARPVGAPVPAVPRAAEGRLMLRHREGVSFIDLQDILLVQREDRATVLYTADGGRYVTGDSLSEMEERLHSDAFFRCHKSYIINLNHIKDITPYGRWTYVVRLENTKHDALITHEKYEELERMFR